MPFVYILRSLKTGRYYVGSSRNPSKRLKEHESGKTKSLRNQKPFEIVYTEQYDTVSDARKREMQIKRYKSGRAFQKLIKT